MSKCSIFTVTLLNVFTTKGTLRLRSRQLPLRKGKSWRRLSNRSPLIGDVPHEVIGQHTEEG